MPNKQQFFSSKSIIVPVIFYFRNALATLNIAVYYLDFNQTNVNKLWTKKTCVLKICYKEEFYHFFRALHGKPERTGSLFRDQS
jgi:hypothetical protein